MTCNIARIHETEYEVYMGRMWSWEQSWFCWRLGLKLPIRAARCMRNSHDSRFCKSKVYSVEKRTGDIFLLSRYDSNYQYWLHLKFFRSWRPLHLFVKFCTHPGQTVSVRLATQISTMRHWVFLMFDTKASKAAIKFWWLFEFLNGNESWVTSLELPRRRSSSESHECLHT